MAHRRERRLMATDTIGWMKVERHAQPTLVEARKQVRRVGKKVRAPCVAGPSGQMPVHVDHQHIQRDF